MNQATPEDAVKAEEQPAREPIGWATINRGNVVDVTAHKPRAPGDSGWEYYEARGYSAPQPLYMGFSDLPSGVVSGLLERSRQVSQEGYSAEHDDRYRNGELLKAAATYLLKAAGLATLRVLPYWPWDRKFFKPNDEKRNLDKAFALLVAEMERRERSESRSES